MSQRKQAANQKVQDSLDYTFYILDNTDINELSDDAYKHFSKSLHNLIFIFDIVRSRAVDILLVEALKICIRILKDESHKLRTNVVGTLPIPLNKANVAFKVFQLKYLNRDNVKFNVTEDNLKIEYDYTR